MSWGKVPKDTKIEPVTKIKMRRLFNDKGWDTETFGFNCRLLGLDDSMVGKSVESWMDSLTEDKARGILDRMADL